MNWLDDPLLEGDHEDIAIRGQLQLAMYAIHLNMGHSIYCKQIKSATIEQYVHAAATFLSHFTGVDFRKDCQADSHMGHILGSVYKDLRRYESFPNRREAYNLAMHAAARILSLGLSTLTLLPALVDGFEQGLCAGYRLSEWAQTSGNYPIGSHQVFTASDGSTITRAIVPNDIRAQTRGLGRVAGLAIASHPLDTITHIWVKFRVQKNGSHGEEKMWIPNADPNGVCVGISLTLSHIKSSTRQQVSKCHAGKMSLSHFFKII